jgi:probable HAF family extracellular repeat protein
MHDLGTLGGPSCQAYAFNDSGQIVGYADTAGGAEHAFLYNPEPGGGGSMFDLGTFGGLQSSPYDINSSGQVVGGAEHTVGSNARHAFRYDGTPGAGGVMRDLGAAVGFNNTAVAINDNGYVLGYAGNNSILWRPNGSFVDLYTWLKSVNPVAASHWTFELPTDINNSGMIVGVAFYNDGPGGLTDGRAAYLLDASSLVPEPSGAALIGGMALPVLLRRRPGAGTQSAP